MFHPITSLVSFVHSVPCPGPNSALKSPPTIGMHFLLFVVCFSVVLYIFLTWWSAYTELGEVHTHQFDALVFYHDRCIDGPFVDVLGVDSFLSPLLRLLSYFPASMKMCFWCVSQISDLSGLHVSLINIAFHLQPSNSHTITSILSLECIDLMFFCSTMSVVSLLFSLSCFSFQYFCRTYLCFRSS